MTTLLFPSMARWPVRVTSALLALAAGGLSARAEGEAVEGGGTKSRISWEVDAGISGIGETRFDGVSKDGDVETLGSLLRAVGTAEASNGMNYRFGLQLQRQGLLEASGRSAFLVISSRIR